jgi:hypothetical protein
MLCFCFCFSFEKGVSTELRFQAKQALQEREREHSSFRSKQISWQHSNLAQVVPSERKRGRKPMSPEQFRKNQ